MGLDEDRFPSKIYGKLICAICRSVVEDPVQCTSANFHLFCKNCLKQEYRHRQECPQCKAKPAIREVKEKGDGLEGPWIAMPIVTPVCSLVNDLDIECRFRDNGCRRVVKVAAMADHERFCGFNYSEAVAARLLREDRIREGQINEKKFKIEELEKKLAEAEQQIASEGRKWTDFSAEDTEFEVDMDFFGFANDDD